MKPQEEEKLCSLKKTSELAFAQVMSFCCSIGWGIDIFCWGSGCRGSFVRGIRHLNSHLKSRQGGLFVFEHTIGAVVL